MSPLPRNGRPLRRLVALAVATCTLAGCASSSDGSTGPNLTPTGATGLLAATIDGAAQTADSSTVRAVATPAIAGGIKIAGTFLAGVNTHLMTINLYNIDKPGTYPLGVNPTVYGGYVTDSRTSGATWQTPLSGESGEVVITAISATRIAGTFHFFATPFTGTPATGTRSVTLGRFDVPVAGTVKPVPANTGAILFASIDGLLYNAAHASLIKSGAIHTVISMNTSYKVSLLLSGITGPGTYPIALAPPNRNIIVEGGTDSPAGTHCCWGPVVGDSGSVTITSLTADRMRGTFTVKLLPRAGTAATAPMMITNGTFDLGFVDSPP
jgi:hypothetical protein